MSGYVRTALLLAALTALFLVLGYFIGGQSGMMIALVVALGMNAFAYWNSDKMVLRMHNAQEIDAQAAPDLFRMVEQLCRRAGLPMPRIYIIHTDQPNAFATGRNPQNAAVAVTTGLIERLSREELAGVVAHELAHISNHDTLIMTITATLAGALSMLANFGLFFGGANSDARNNPLGPIGMILMVILAPMAAMLVQMAISRSREYEADRIGAEICGQPMWLASALERIDAYAQRIDNHAAERNPATAHMFIINPLHAHSMDSLFSTHPATGNRVRALRQMVGLTPTQSRVPPRPAGPSGGAGPTGGAGPWGGGRRGPWG